MITRICKGHAVYFLCYTNRNYTSLKLNPSKFKVQCKIFGISWPFMALSPSSKLEEDTLSAVRYRLFSIIAATLHICRLSSPSETRRAAWET